MKKKLLHFWRKLTNKYISPETNIKNEVVLVNDDSDMLAERLGITDERITELLNICINLIPDGKSINYIIITDALIGISKQCKHPNEVCFCTFVLGQTYEKSMNPMMRLMGMLG